MASPLAPALRNAADRAPLVQVLGAGPTGALAALAMADAGWRVIVSDPATEAQLSDRSRAYALTHSSRLLLQRLKLWQALQPCLCPFDQLHLHDQATGASLSFSPSDLPRDARRDGPQPVGWIVRHHDLMALLLTRLHRHPGIDGRIGERASLTGSPAESPDLVLAADGPGSPARAALGIGQWRLSYRQACLTAQVTLRDLEAGEVGAAWELLRPEGPFAVLPLEPGKAQLVWSAPASRNQRRQELEPTAFLEQLAAVLPPALEVDGLLDQPRSFPVGLSLAHRLHRGRTLLVGESAHRCHPVGGQGLNLCWRDVAVLHRLAGLVRSGAIRLESLPGRYARSRWPDLLLTLLATDLLVRLFSNRTPLLLPLRWLALSLLARFQGLRSLCLGVMSAGPGQPLRTSPQ